jgi:hypothetical protein
MRWPARIAASSSRNAVSFSSARTTKRFPSSRCASATKTVSVLMIHGCDPAATPAGFLEIVGDDVLGTRQVHGKDCGEPDSAPFGAKTFCTRASKRGWPRRSSSIGLTLIK